MTSKASTRRAVRADLAPFIKYVRAVTVRRDWLVTVSKQDLDQRAGPSRRPSCASSTTRYASPSASMSTDTTPSIRRIAPEEWRTEDEWIARRDPQLDRGRDQFPNCDPRVGSDSRPPTRGAAPPALANRHRPRTQRSPTSHSSTVLHGIWPRNTRQLPREMHRVPVGTMQQPSPVAQSACSSHSSARPTLGHAPVLGRQSELELSNDTQHFSAPALQSASPQSMNPGCDAQEVPPDRAIGARAFGGAPTVRAGRGSSCSRFRLVRPRSGAPPLLV